MAVDNLNYYTAWLPAGQQTDKYSSQPWCLKSKNLDIFSSSKSVKATAWSSPSTIDSDIIKQDWRFILKTDWNVYERIDWVDTLFMDPSTNFPSYPVTYSGYGWETSSALRWTVQDMSVKYEWDEMKSIVVFTDRASMVYSRQKFIVSKDFYFNDMPDMLTYDQYSPYNNGWPARWYLFKWTAANYESGTLRLKIDNWPFTSFPLRLFAVDNEDDKSTIRLSSIKVRWPSAYYYDPQTDSMLPYSSTTRIDVPFTWSITDTETNWVEVIIPTVSRPAWYFLVEIGLNRDKKEGQTINNWQHWELYVDINWGPESSFGMMRADWTASDWDSNYCYSYLPLRERKLVDVGSYAYSSSYWMKWTSFQPLYKWTWSWIQVWDSKNNKLIYDFVQDMWWESDTAMDVVDMTVWNEQVYMIGNLDGNWYIIPCDLSGWRGVPYIAEWCTFHAATNIDYLLYLVWEDRWISTLWVFNQQELVPIVWWKLEAQYTDLVGVDETYKFNGDLINWRKNLILSTTDNRIFQYGQTYGWKWGVFIHTLPSNATIKWITTRGNDLEINYSITENNTTTDYTIKYQDDTPIKNYNTEWSATYPIILWNHLLEKEESDLYTSYILPSADTSLEFRWMANHYHFWTFTSSDNVTIDPTGSYKIAWATWNYELKFIERNEDQYTFRLEGDLPVQTASTMKITDSEGVDVINYTSFNHFRKIWEITTGGYQEWEFRFHNLNNKLELPKSHSLQIMVKGKGTTDYTPELFALDLVANQRDRW